MKDTLVKRLRGEYEVGPDSEFGTRSFADFIPPISFEAADRIEELEAILAEYQDAIASITPWLSASIKDDSCIEYITTCDKCFNVDTQFDNEKNS